jgi:hypothetical protein
MNAAVQFPPREYFVLTNAGKPVFIRYHTIKLACCGIHLFTVAGLLVKKWAISLLLLASCRPSYLSSLTMMTSFAASTPEILALLS